MLWVVGALALVAVLVLGLVLGYKTSMHSLQTGIFRLKRNSVTDRSLLLALVRRDIANVLIRQDPDRFLTVYQKAYEFTKTVGQLSQAAQAQMLKTITDEFPYFSDFDLLSRRDYILEAPLLFGSPSSEEIENHFQKLVQFQAIMKSLDPEWKYQTPISDKDIEIAARYVEELKGRVHSLS